MSEVGDTLIPRTESQASQKLFIHKFDGGWMSAARSQAQQERPAILRITPKGAIEARGGDEKWGYASPDFKVLYQQTREELQAQGVEFPEATQFPQTETSVNRVLKNQNSALTLSEADKGKVVLLVVNKAYPAFKEKESVAYLGKVKAITKTEGNISIEFEEQQGTDTVFPRYTGWEFMYAHFSPDEEHITQVHHGDINSTRIQQDFGTGEWNMQVFGADEELLDIADNEIGRRAKRRGKPKIPHAGHDMEMWEELEFEDVFRKAVNK